MGIPRRHAVGLDSVQPGGEWGARYAALRRQAGSGFLVALLGNRGTGKTQMAARLCEEVADELESKRELGSRVVYPRYVRAMDWFIDIRRAFRPDGPTEADVLKEYRNPPLLVIDEIHLRGESPWEDRLLANLIDHRYGAVKDTLIISNLTWDAFERSIDPSIVDRIRETGGRVSCDWASFRAK